MSTASGTSTQRPSQSQSQSQQTNGQTSKSSPLVPTNTVTTKDGTTVRVRIDPALAVDDVIRQLCLNLKIEEPAVLFALRDETDELVTDDNLRKKIREKVNLKLVSAPIIEASEIVDKLSVRDERTLRMTLFSLQRFIREEQFANEFLQRDGLKELMDVISVSHGNILAYALTAMQNLMELDYGWSTLSLQFISTVIRILATQSLINVCRPATAILKKLVEADPRSVPGQTGPSSSRSPPTAPPGSVYIYGFDVVFELVRKEKGLLDTVIARLGSPDTGTVLNSMLLINSLLSHATDTYWEEFITELERLNVQKAVVRLMSSPTIDELTSSILDFQANVVRVTYRKKTTLVDPLQVPQQYSTLRYIWQCSKAEEVDDIDDYEGEMDGNGVVGVSVDVSMGFKRGKMKWRKLGFETDDMAYEFDDVGVLGLDCLKNFVKNDPEYFAKVVLEQLSRSEERRCPIARASNEIVEILSEHWAIFAPGYSTSTTFQPFFLSFQKVHTLAMQFFLRMWSESGAAAGDAVRVLALTRSQINVALKDESTRQWHEVEHDFMESEYRAVRDRQMKELEMEDDLLNKVPVRNFRAKLYKESYEFVRQQRIQCLLQGTWFVNAIPLINTLPRDVSRRPPRPWRFMRLDNGLKYLHYVDSSTKFPIRNGLEDLPERIDMNLISEIATGTSAAPPNVLQLHGQVDVAPNPNSPPVASLLSFSLISANEGSLADQIAPDKHTWADWTDGLNMLRRDGGHIATQETADLVQALTEIGLKIKLLDLSGEKVDIPSGLTAGPPPSNTDFFFSDLSYDTEM